MPRASLSVYTELVVLDLRRRVIAHSRDERRCRLSRDRKDDPPRLPLLTDMGERRAENERSDNERSATTRSGVIAPELLRRSGVTERGDHEHDVWLR